MKVKKDGKVLIINDALRDRYVIDLGYEEVFDVETIVKTKKTKVKKNVINDVPTFDNTDKEE